MGNLTCVLQKCGQLTEDMEINMDWYATALRAEEPETGFTWDVEGSAVTSSPRAGLQPPSTGGPSPGCSDARRSSSSALTGPRDVSAQRPSFLRTWRPSMGRRAMRRLQSRSPPSACQKTSMTLPPSLWPSSTTLSLWRRSLLKGSSGTSTGTPTCKQRNSSEWWESWICIGDIFISAHCFSKPPIHPSLHCGTISTVNTFTPQSASILSPTWPHNKKIMVNDIRDGGSTADFMTL